MVNINYAAVNYDIQKAIKNYAELHKLLLCLKLKLTYSNNAEAPRRPLPT